MKSSLKQQDHSESVKTWERETGLKAEWLLNRVPINVLPLEDFDLPSNHRRPQRLPLGVNLLQGQISNHMAGIRSKFTAAEVVEMMKNPSVLTMRQISYIRELINHCSPWILQLLSNSLGLTIYEWARVMGICEINNRRLAEWINSYVPDYEVSFYWKRIW
ncbi:MAG: hypothetical protein F4227_00870 [Gammaproteobacteria bacterium]|nr:hypothetical protein [Gammaproteobacteria bacterium]MYF01563.1 hypothetical protein [Gammaproteobacteria bacterium]MYI77923.1 hypothetical protein [Gammaproteobacteria bacterium]